MSEVMTCMPFEQLMNWVLEEKKTKGTVFGQHRAYAAETDRKLNIFERNLETPIGPAAGPHTQLTQNIVASYYAGARFFELKTVQKMDGAELAACINRPCILADDEGYNCEWSTELYVPQAMGEYIKALLSVLEFHQISRRSGSRTITAGRESQLMLITTTPKNFLLFASDYTTYRHLFQYHL